MLNKQYPLYLANRPQQPNTDLDVTDKYTGEVATRVALADEAMLDAAIAAADAAREPMAAMKPYERRKVLEHCVERFTERAEELAQALCIEAGKPIKDSRGEVTRLIETFRIAACETEADIGAVMPLANAERSAQYSGMYKPCLVYTSPSPRDAERCRTPSSCRKKQPSRRRL
ncbi:aldehyde dehydrogenase family protein, partial [bacterium]|nr:aldehyde dehydrogenase family protein [bacterium]